MEGYAPWQSGNNDVEPHDEERRGVRMSRERLHDSGSFLVEDFSIRDDDSVLNGYSDRFQLALPYRGMFEWSAGAGPTLIDSNQFLLVAGGREFHEQQPIPRVGHSSIIFTPDPEIIDELLAERNSEMPAMDVALSTKLPLRRLLQRWLGISRGDGPTPLERDELCIAALRTVLGGEHRVRRGASALVNRAKEIIIANTLEPLSLREIADQLGTSPIYLTQAFARIEGVPLYRYQLNLRLAKAMVELPKTDSITELALDLGFSSHSHFTSAFRAFTNQSPSTFRATYRPRPI